MKKRKIILAYCITLSFLIDNAHGQLKTWYFARQQVQVDVPVPVVTPLSFVGGSNGGAANGIYKSDNSSQIQFNVSQPDIYNQSHLSIGNIIGHQVYDTPEIAIVPFPDNDGCTQNKYYIFNSCPTGINATLRVTILDMSRPEKG